MWNGQRSVAEPGPTPSPWSILSLRFPPPPQMELASRLDQKSVKIMAIHCTCFAVCPLPQVAHAKPPGAKDWKLLITMASYTLQTPPRVAHAMNIRQDKKVWRHVLRKLCIFPDGKYVTHMTCVLICDVWLCDCGQYILVTGCDIY